MLTGLKDAAERFVVQRFSEIFAARPFIIYDIGAAGGLFPLLSDRVFPHQRTYGFEPEPREYAKLAAVCDANDRCRVFNLAIANATGSIAFFIHETATHSSVVRFAETMTQVEVEAARLDDLGGKLGLPPADFIKIDIEGGELAAIASGTDMLDRHVLGLVTEIGFWRHAEGQTRFSELDSFLTAHGFILFDMTINKSNWSNIGGKKGKIRSGDALYIRNIKQLYDDSLVNAPREEARAQLFKLLLLSYRYLYVDYALEVADFGHAVGLISDDEFTAFARELATVTDVSRRLPDFPGREMVSRFLDAASYVVNQALKKDKPVVYSRLGNSQRLARRQALPGEARISNPAFGRQQGFKTIKLDR